jgi:uncharacterized caspase-like protein
MPGSAGTHLGPDQLGAPRAALVIATTSYQDLELRQLRAPAHDAEDLAGVLADPRIGAFTVTRVIDQDERQVRREIDAFLSGCGIGDLVVVYLSCHGVLDRRGRLYFAATDTLKTQLGSTGIPSAWLLDQLDECRARRQVLILDCCFSGSFAHGGKGDTDLGLERRLAGQGRGRAVLTASRAGEYSFEGQALPGAAVAGSVFTAGLVEGLHTGAADSGGDGYINLDEAYDYAYSYVQSSGASQTPQRWLYGGEGKIVLARSPRGAAVTSAPLPEALAASLDSPYPAVRIGAVHALREWLFGADPARALSAEQKLRLIADTDVPAVAAAARAYLAGPGPADTARRLGHEIPPASPPRPQAQPRPTAAPSGPHTLAATLTHGSQWLTVHAVVFSPDGRFLASGCHDTKIQLWDPTTGRLVRTLTPEKPIWSELTGPIYSVAFSPDGRLLASAGEDMTVRLWDPATGQSVRTLTGHTRTINALAFSPDGRLLASASDDLTVRLWEPAPGQSARTLSASTLTGHTGWVRAVVFSPDGRLLASASDDLTVRLWDPATGESVRTLTGHTGCVRSVAFSPDGHLLASAGDEGTVRLWR